MTIEEASTGQRRPRGDPGRAAGGNRNGRLAQAGLEQPRRRRKTSNPAAGYHVAELYLERRGARSIVGNIYKGRVDNVLAGLEAAFVDIGLEKNGFLHVDEIVLPGVEAPRRGRGTGRDSRQITDMLKPGQEIVVQVVKDPLKTKGARLSMDLTIAGRYMVYAPYGEGVGVSRRLDDAERDRLRKEAAKLDLKGAGAIIRTAAQGAKRADLERELLYLFKLNEVLQKRVEETPAPALVFQEADLSVRVVRDIFSAAFERAIVDDPKQHHRLVSFFSRTAPELVDHVELWEDDHAAVRGVRRRGGPRLDAVAPGRPAQWRLPDDRLRRGADRDRRQLRARSSAAARARGWRTRSPRPTSRPPTRSSASCGCATSAGSSSSTSSTWPAPATATPCSRRCASRSTRTGRRRSWSRSRRSGWSR